MLRNLAYLFVFALIVLVFIQYFYNVINPTVLQVILWITVLLFVVHLALKRRKKDKENK